MFGDVQGLTLLAQFDIYKLDVYYIIIFGNVNINTMQIT